MSAFDPTTAEGGRRARGLASIVSGTGPSYGLLFGLGVDSRVHTYAASTLLPLSPKGTFKHPNMNTNSFWVRLAISPDGRSIVSGSSVTGKGASAFLFDVSQTVMAAPSTHTANVYVVTVNYNAAGSFILSLPFVPTPATTIVRSASIPYGGF